MAEPFFVKGLRKQMEDNTNNPRLNRYKPSTLIGNWEEDQFLQQDKLCEYLKRKDCGALYIQKTNSLLNTALTKVNLTVAAGIDEYVYNNSVVMIQSMCDPQFVMAANPELPERYDTVPEHFQVPCAVTGCRARYPCARNSVMLVRCADWITDGRPLSYGEPLYFVTLPPAGNLYLHTGPLTSHKRAKWSSNQEVTLVPHPVPQCQWRILPRTIAYRMELEGQPIVRKADLIINHIYTNNHLALESKFNFPTIFGWEKEISCHTYLDQFKYELKSNIWRISNPETDEFPPPKFVPNDLPLIPDNQGNPGGTPYPIDIQVSPEGNQCEMELPPLPPDVPMPPCVNTTDGGC